jgi:hypothetical protein
MVKVQITDMDAVSAPVSFVVIYLYLKKDTKAFHGFTFTLHKLVLALNMSCHLATKSGLKQSEGNRRAENPISNMVQFKKYGFLW